MGVKWGVLGTANIALGCTIPGMIKAEGCELYAVAGRNEAKVNSFKEKFGFKKGYVGYDALLADPEVQAVYIPLPNNIHFEWVTKALKAGKHVLCEKPLAMNAKEAEKMYACAKENNVILMEAYAYLHSPYVAAVVKDIKDGLIGKVDYIESAFLTQGYIEDFRLHKEFGGGAMYDLGCYCTTMILSCIDSKYTSVKAVADFSDEGVDTLTDAIIDFENGAKASFNVGMNLGIGTNSRFDRLYIHGDKGCIKSDVEYNQEGDLEYTIVSNGEKTVKKVFAGQNYSLELEDMNRCIENGGEPLVSPEFSIYNAKLIDEVLNAIGYN
ncbi:MAG: Gfo/Idh/MocA family oxidoreductase [Lachnospiraceae bacterium]|nr:Gfo/Idh/MocA family oxidoreductase [Lachnospiraceae bacterium]